MVVNFSSTLFTYLDGMPRIAFHPARPALLPDGVVDALKRRLIATGGVVVCLFAGLLLAAILTYHPSDPSLNSAADGPARNLFGWPGAYAADLLLQMLGVVAVLLVPILAAWGWRLISRKGISVFGCGRSCWCSA